MSHPVVVEVFTSQGCATCPPADRLLAMLGAESGGAVVPLAFHVDFWNRLGWRDPFSSAEWTRRQESYARALGAQIYTPQAVIDGRVELVASEEAALRSAIAQAATRPAASITLGAVARGSEIHVEVEVTRPESLLAQKLDLMLAIFETGLVTPVSRGENGGRTLRNDYVVRSLQRAARLPAKEPHRRHTATLQLDDEWNRTGLGVAAFVQEPGSLEIHGAGVWLLQPSVVAAP